MSLCISKCNVLNELYSSFSRLEDVKDKVDKMEQSVQFRITAARDNEVMDRLYSRSRGKILFALPPKVKIVST